jgi:hypothetical protein
MIAGAFRGPAETQVSLPLSTVVINKYLIEIFKNTGILFFVVIFPEPSI